MTDGYGESPLVAGADTPHTLAFIPEGEDCESPHPTNRSPTPW